MEVDVCRRIYLESDLDDDRITASKPSNTCLNLKLSKYELGRSRMLQYSKNLFPILSWLPQYKWKSFLKHDFVCGLTVAIIYIPQALAYSTLAQLPAVSGLYMGFICPLLYMMMGSSKTISLGVFSVIALMISSAIDSGVSNDIIAKSNGTLTTDQANYIVATTLTFMVGILQIILSVMKFGFLSNLISATVTNAFVFGSCILVVTSQVSYIFGVRFERSNISSYSRFLDTYVQIIRNIKSANVTEITISSVSIIISLIFRYVSPKVEKYIKVPLPSEFIVLMIAYILSYKLDFETKYGVRTVGDIPSGFPGVSLPKFSIMGSLISYSITIAIINYGCSISLARGLAEKTNEKIQFNTEMFAYGMCNFVSSFFYCFVSSASLSRSAIQANLGKTQLSCVVSSTIILMVIFFAASIFSPLPLSTLSAIIIVALINVFKNGRQIVKFYQISLFEFILWILTVTVTVIFGVTYGLLSGVSLSLIRIIWQLIRPQLFSIGEIKSTSIYKENKYFTVEHLKQIKIIQFKAPLLFLNKDRLMKVSVSCIQKLNNEYPKKSKYIILDGKYWSEIDMEGCQMIKKVVVLCVTKEVNCVISNLGEEAYQFIMRVLSLDEISVMIFPTTLDAVYYINRTLMSGKVEESISDEKFTIGSL